MRRGFAFVLIGPAQVAIGVGMWTTLVMELPGFLVGHLVSLAFLLALPTSCGAGFLDNRLARSLPMPLRASLTAAISAIVFAVVALGVLSAMGAPSLGCVIHEVGIVGLILLLSMGACSLLSSDDDSRRQRPDGEVRAA